MAKRTPEQKAARKIHAAINRDKIREYANRYYAENKENIREKERAKQSDELRERRQLYHQANREERNRKSREWKVNNAGSVRDYARRQREANPDLFKERSNKWQRDNAEYVKEQRRLAKLDPEKIARDRERRKRWWAKNRERILEKTREQRKLRRSIYVARTRNKRAAARGADGEVTYEQIMALWELQNGLCVFFASCGNLLEKKKNGYHVDHIEPICPQDPNRPIGGNRIENIQLLCGSCNIRKSNKDPYGFAQANGLLFCDITNVAPKRSQLHRR